MDRVLTLCRSGESTRKKYPRLTANPGPLTKGVKRPEKQAAIENFVSRFSKSVEPVGRPEGCEDVVVPDALQKKKKKKKSKKRAKTDTERSQIDKTSKGRKSKKRTKRKIDGRQDDGASTRKKKAK